MTTLAPDLLAGEKVLDLGAGGHLRRELPIP
ncbi:hypothetical protein LCGC14_1216500 [marine sediment metagenome]|uniref:Uncharacterized protein n=1 Tax=marine sediment metagenome TaxID=412755 RepID=A0A0F9LGK6_9ZZZZ